MRMVLSQKPLAKLSEARAGCSSKHRGINAGARLASCELHAVSHRRRKPRARCTIGISRHSSSGWTREHSAAQRARCQMQRTLDAYASTGESLVAMSSILEWSWIHEALPYVLTTDSVRQKRCGDHQTRIQVMPSRAKRSGLPSTASHAMPA